MNRIFVIALFLVCTQLYSQPITQFPLGDGTSKWGILTNFEGQPYSLRFGGRLQGIIKAEGSDQDSYLRRLRFNIEAKFSKKAWAYIDIRNDSINQQNNSEGSFNAGDAYLSYHFLENKLYLRAFRAKVDVSRSQTASSARLVYLNRTTISDFASNYVNESRRATNLQLNGDLGHMTYHLVVGDGVAAGDLKDLQNNQASSIRSQSLMWGSKLRFKPFKNWDEGKGVKETFYGHGQHFSIAAGYFNTSSIKFDTSDRNHEIDRALQNYELSFHYYGLNLMAEYFLFKNVIEDMSQEGLNLSDSDGFYALIEYTFKQLYYLAPFYRYEEWDRFKDYSSAYEISHVFGINWYVKGEKARFGLAYSDKSFGGLLNTSNSNQIEVYSMFNF